MKKVIALILVCLLAFVCLAEGEFRCINKETGVVLREGPSADTDQICFIPFTAKVELVGNPGDGFTKVIYNGKTGYVWGQYLTEEDLTGADWKTMYVTSYIGLVMRKTASFEAETVAMVPFGTEVTVKMVDDFFSFCSFEKDGEVFEGFLWNGYLSEQQPDEETAKSHHEEVKDQIPGGGNGWDEWEDDGSLDDWENLW